MGGRGWAGWSGVRGGKRDNCNSIINKYIKKINNSFHLSYSKFLYLHGFVNIEFVRHTIIFIMFLIFDIFIMPDAWFCLFGFFVLPLRLER